MSYYDLKVLSTEKELSIDYIKEDTEGITSGSLYTECYLAELVLNRSVDCTEYVHCASCPLYRRYLARHNVVACL